MYSDEEKRREKYWHIYFTLYISKSELPSHEEQVMVCVSGGIRGS